MLAANEVDHRGEQPPSERPDASRRVAGALSDLLHSPRFKDSPQLQALLSYVVTEALKGDEDALKERMIGIYVFGRRPDYDTSGDPIVRSRMGLLRKRLAQYYETARGEQAGVEITIPTGTYCPSFILRPMLGSRHPSSSSQGLLSVPSDTHSQASAHSHNEAQSATSAPQKITPVDSELSPAPDRTLSTATSSPEVSRPDSRLQVSIFVAVLSFLLLVAGWLYLRSSRSELSLLWAPILDARQPIYVYTGTMPVFETRTPLDEADSPEDRSSPVRVPDPPAVEAPYPGPDHVLSWGEGMLTGSVYADIRLAAFLSDHKRTPVMRTGANLPFMDLKGSPLILVGSFDNYWTRVMNENLPFYLDRGFGIRERDGAHRRWFNPLKAEMTPRMMEDFALVFRVMNAKNGAPVLGIVGLSTCGTHAAANFVTDPSQMRALADIPRAALLGKNIELVLRTSLVNCAPTSVEVVASRVW